MLTIGLPFFNNEKTLTSAIQSVLIQTYNDWELILVDDGSTDNSTTIAKKFAGADGRIQLVSDGINRGLIYRLNQIIDLAQGDYIARMDSDDMMMHDKLARQMEMLQADKNIDVVDTAAYIINEKGEPTGKRGMTDLKSWDKKRTFKEVLLFHPTVVAKASWYRQHKYNENFVRSEDFELWCRTFDNTVFARVYEPLFIYREGRVNVKNYSRSNQSYRKILKTHSKGVLTPVERGVELIKSHCKTKLYHSFSFFNMQQLLTTKRNAALTREEKHQLREVIEQISHFEPKVQHK
jgi:glycosyltransferase involved in cell wall biosynthesis